MGLSDYEYDFSQLMDEIFPDCNSFAEVYAVFYYEHPHHLFGSGTDVLKQNWNLYQKSLQPAPLTTFYNPWA